MKSYRATPSAFTRLEECMGAAVLPNVNEEWESSERGRALHLYMERRAQGDSRAAALTAIPEEWREDAERIEVPEHVTLGLPELALALDPRTRTARVLGKAMTREKARKAARDGEIPMVPDWMALEGERGARVIDYKTGRQEDLARAADHLQLLTYAATALLAFDLETVRAELWHWDGLRWWVDAVELGYFEADEVLDRVEALLERVEEARAVHARDGVMPRLSVGAWCSWCPAARFCPARVAPLAMALGREKVPDTLTPEELGQTYELLRQARDWIDERLDDIKALAHTGPIPLPSGKELRVQEVETRKVDVAKALPVLAARFGRKAALSAVRKVRTIIWEALGDVMREQVLPARLAQHREGRKPSAAALTREARETLVAAGAVKVSTYARLKEVRPELEASNLSLDETP